MNNKESLNQDFLIRENLVRTPEKYDLFLNRLIDSTLLKPETTLSDIEFLVNEALEFNFKSICIPPCYVNYARSKINESSLKICTVIGFPFGFQSTYTKQKELEDALNHGADEIDFVQNIGFCKAHDSKKIDHEFKLLKHSCPNKIIKVILETSALTLTEISNSIKLACEADIDIIKTSTGYGKFGATKEHIDFIYSELKSLGCEKRVGIKASGGIKTLQDALSFVKLGATRIGTSSGKNIMLNLSSASQNTNSTQTSNSY